MNIFSFYSVLTLEIISVSVPVLVHERPIICIFVLVAVNNTAVLCSCSCSMVCLVLKKVKHRVVENMNSGTADALGLSRAILCNGQSSDHCNLSLVN